MSKIFDAFRKAEGTAQGADNADARVEPFPAPAYDVRRSEATAPPLPFEPEPLHPPTELLVSSSGLDLPLEFVRELGTLRGTIDQILPGKAQKTILMTGAVGGEGASTVAAAFARLLAEDQRTLVALVDADLRNTQVRRLPSVDPSAGFPGVLSGRISIEQALVGTTMPNLIVLPGGVPTESPLRLCTTDNLRAPLDYLKRHFHYVIIDAAPLLESPESVPLAGQTDGTILVVRAARTKREVVQRALETMEKFQGRVLGAILNRQQYVIPEFIYRRI